LESPPDVEQEKSPVTKPARPAPRVSILVLLGLSGGLLALFVGLLLNTLPQAFNRPIVKSQTTPTAQPQSNVLSRLNIGEASQLLASNLAIVYENDGKLYLASATSGTSKQLDLQGYRYNQNAPALLLPSGQLLYSGDGIWLADLTSGSTQQIAKATDGTIITSLVASNDGMRVAWSEAPGNGKGSLQIYAGSLGSPSMVYEGSAENCPCFRAFGFLDTKDQVGKTLLLTDDRGDHHSTSYGLWGLDLTSSLPGKLMQYLSNEKQGPLVLQSSNNLLLYAGNEGVVPTPSDHSVPDEVAALNYANSLELTQIKSTQDAVGQPAEVLPAQDTRSNTAKINWVTTPYFSPDGHTLAYVLFSSDEHEPFSRHSALYTVQYKITDQKLQVSKPQLLAAATSRFIELGPWINDHQLSFYSDGTIYVVDTKAGQVARILETGGPYTRILGSLNKHLAE
jgi:hypothetical protein